MLAKYDLGLQAHLATFDFFTWLVAVQARGATEIVLANTHHPHQKFGMWGEVNRRIESIIKPGIAFSGLPWRLGHDGDLIFDTIHMTNIPDDFPRLKSVLPPSTDVKYTVTIRNQYLKMIRNSDEWTWREFARNIGAVVIEDYRIKPIHLHKRMAMYAGARMNFGVCNGPVAMLFLTDYPVAMCNCARKMKGWPQHGIAKGDQFRWAKPHQRLWWDVDIKLDLLMHRFKEIWAHV